jgi:protein involved in polysaccharide export with SLBB domain
MEHPFLDKKSLAGKTLEEIQTNLADLTNKLAFAQRTGNLALIQQLYMVMESYRNEASKKLDEIFKKQNLQNQVSIQKEDQIGNKNRT